MPPSPVAAAGRTRTVSRGSAAEGSSVDTEPPIAWNPPANLFGTRCDARNSAATRSVRT